MIAYGFVAVVVAANIVTYIASNCIQTASYFVNVIPSVIVKLNLSNCWKTFFDSSIRHV